MTKIDKLDVSWNGLLQRLTRFVEEWRPPRLSREKEYRDHLLNALREAIPMDSKAEKEYRHLGTTIDIWVKWQGILASDEVAFELKVDLKRKSDFDRLVGQLEGLNPTRNKVLVVLVGETDAALLNRLKERYAKHLVEGLGHTMSIVCVLVGTP